MTFKDIAKLLETNIQTIPNLVQILKKGFEEAEAGSDVEVTQVVSSGTKIASIAVGEESTDIYAPIVSYSTDEYDTGKRWIDGRTIYGKILSINSVSLTKNTWATLYTDESVGNINQLLDAKIIQTVNKGAYTALNFKAEGTAIKALYLEDLNIGDNTYVHIEYIKAAQ